MANRVVHFEIEAEDAEALNKFYTEAFDWKIEKMGDEFGGYFVITTGDPKEPNGINGGLYKTPFPKKTLNAFRCVVSVDDIDEAIKKVEAAGGEIIGEKMDIPGVGINVIVKDPQGNEFSLLQAAPEMLAEK